MPIEYLLLIILDETIKEFVNFIVKNMNHKDYTVIFLRRTFSICYFTIIKIQPYLALFIIKLTFEKSN